MLERAGTKWTTLMCMFIAGCYGERPLVLRGPEGAFGINATQFVEYMYCAWNIQVDKNEVLGCGKSLQWLTVRFVFCSMW